MQRRLKALGYDPGPLDGIYGRLTIRAVKAFQRDYGIAVDGIVGPETLDVLFPPHPASSYPSPSPSPQGGGELSLPWYEEALRLKGTREATGNSDNPLILRWAKRLGIFYSSDSTAWCGLFVSHCIAAALPDEPLPSNPLGARNWLRFGSECEPQLGAVLVFWRGARSGWQGHVGLYAGEDPDGDAFHVLGGNQSDAVSIARIARNRLLGARWPKSAMPPSGIRRTASTAGALSINEA
jgi:uncharacterized protein (TIGR02594 family)